MSRPICRKAGPGALLSKQATGHQLQLPSRPRLIAPAQPCSPAQLEASSERRLYSGSSWGGGATEPDRMALLLTPSP